MYLLKEGYRFIIHFKGKGMDHIYIKGKGIATILYIKGKDIDTIYLRTLLNGISMHPFIWLLNPAVER